MSRFHMRRLVVVAGTLIGLACATHVQARPAPLPPSTIAAVTPGGIGSYYDVLRPWGDWYSVPVFGTVWRPSVAVVGTSFVPYASAGRWDYSPYGWVFVSDYAFGPIVFHYGRWLYLPDDGWVWVPGVVWGPAWVDWRYGGGYVGWSPLPPYGAYYVFSYWSPTWCFVDSYWFPHGRHHYHYQQVNEDEASEFIANTAPVGVQKSPRSDQWSPGPPPDAIGRDARVEVTPTAEINPGDLPREVMQLPENAVVAERPLPSGVRPEVESMAEELAPPPVEGFEPPARVERPPPVAMDPQAPEPRAEQPPPPPVMSPPPSAELDPPAPPPVSAPEAAPPPVATPAPSNAPAPVPPPAPVPAPAAPQDAPPAPAPPPAPPPPARIEAPQSMPQPAAPPTAPSPPPAGSR